MVEIEYYKDTFFMYWVFFLSIICQCMKHSQIYMPCFHYVFCLYIFSTPSIPLSRGIEGVEKLVLADHTSEIHGVLASRDPTVGLLKTSRFIIEQSIEI